MNPVRRPGRAIVQHGQAMVLGMLFAGLAAVAFIRYFGTGQVVAARTKQLHALDAATYSGALVQARALNMLAFLNRTQTGHQVALAHLVTLGSWAALGGTEARQLLIGNPPAYLIGMLFGVDHGTAYLASAGATNLDSLARAQGELAHAYAQHDDLIHTVLQSVQEDVLRSVPDARMAAINEVLAANYSTTGFQVELEHDTWPGPIHHYSGQSLAPFVRNVASLYQFLASRNHTEKNPWVVDMRCPSLRHQLRRRGTTELDAAGLWQSIDTQSFHALRSNRWIGCYYREYPMGWGWIPTAKNQHAAGPYVDNPPDNFSSQDFWRWVQEATNWDIASGNANPLANSRAVAARMRWEGGGLPVYLDIKNDPDPVLSFSVKLRHPGPQDLTITTRSAAETFFQRPHRRADGQREASNLFHPYWQARLAQQGQALAEALVVLVALLALWVAIAWLGRFQDMALQAQHASSYAAFTLTRDVNARPLAAIRNHFFAGRAHQWADQSGRQVLSDSRKEVELFVSRQGALGDHAQPGASSVLASVLRREWSLEDSGVARADIKVTPTSAGYPPIGRHTAILFGEGHASSDHEAQQRVAQSDLGWRNAYHVSRALGQTIAGPMQAVDAAWDRPEPQFDWLGPWAGEVPTEHLSPPGGYP